MKYFHQTNIVAKVILTIFVLLFPNIACCIDNTIYTCPNPAVTSIFISQDDCLNNCAPNYYRCQSNNVSYKDQPTCLDNCGGVEGVCNRQEGTMTQYTCNCVDCIGKGVKKFDRASCENECTEPAWECGLDHQLYNTSTDCGNNCNNVFQGTCQKKMMDITTFVCPADNAITNVDLAACDAQCNQQTFTCAADGIIYKTSQYGANAQTVCNENCSPHAAGTCTSSMLTDTKWICPDDTANPKTQFADKTTCESEKCTATTYACTLPGQPIDGSTYTTQADCGTACLAQVPQACEFFVKGGNFYDPLYVCPNDPVTGESLGATIPYVSVPASYFTKTSLADCNTHCSSKPTPSCPNQYPTPYEIRTGTFNSWGSDLTTCTKSCQGSGCFLLKTGTGRPSIGGRSGYNGDFSLDSSYLSNGTLTTAGSIINPTWIAIPGDPTDGKAAAFGMVPNGYDVYSSDIFSSLSSCLAYIAAPPPGSNFSMLADAKNYYISIGQGASYQCTGGVVSPNSGCTNAGNVAGFESGTAKIYTCGPPSNGIVPPGSNKLYVSSTECSNSCKITQTGTCNSSNTVTPCTPVVNTTYSDKVTCIFPQDTRTPSLNNTIYSGNGSESADQAACQAACQADIPTPCGSALEHMDCQSHIEPTYLGYECTLGTTTTIIGGTDETQDAIDCAAQCKTEENGGCVETTKTTQCDSEPILGYIGFECDVTAKKTYLGIKNGAGQIDEMLDFNVCQSSCQSGAENCILVDSNSVCLSNQQTTAWECLNPAQINFFNTQAQCDESCADNFFRCMTDKTTYLNVDQCNKFCAVKNQKDCTRIEQSGTEWNCPALEYKSITPEDCREHCTEPGWNCLLNDKKYKQNDENLCLTECTGAVTGDCVSDKDNWYVCPIDSTIKNLNIATCQNSCLESKWTCNSNNYEYTDKTAQSASFVDGATQCTSECDGKVHGTCTPQTQSVDQWTCSTDTNNPKTVYTGTNAESTCGSNCFETMWRCSLPGAPINPATGQSIDGSTYHNEADCDPTTGGACKITDGCLAAAKPGGNGSALYVCPNDPATGDPLSGSINPYVSMPASYYSFNSIDDCNTHCSSKPTPSCPNQYPTPYEIRTGSFNSWGSDLTTCTKSCQGSGCFLLKTGTGRPSIGGRSHYAGGFSLMSSYLSNGTLTTAGSIINPTWIAIPGDPTDGKAAAFGMVSLGYDIYSSQIFDSLSACNDFIASPPPDSDFAMIAAVKTSAISNGTESYYQCTGGVKMPNSGCVDQGHVAGFEVSNTTIYTCGTPGAGMPENNILWTQEADCNQHCTAPIYGTCSSFPQDKTCDNNPLVTYLGTRCDTKNGGAPNGTLYNNTPGNAEANYNECANACFEQITPECTIGHNTIPCMLQPDYRGVNCMINNAVALDDLTGQPLTFFTDTSSEAADLLMCHSRCSKSNDLCVQSTNNVDCESSFSTAYSGFVCQEDYSIWNTGDPTSDEARCGQNCFSVIEQGVCEAKTVSPNKRCIEIKLETPKCTAISESTDPTFECQSDQQTYPTNEECLSKCTTTSGKCDLYNHPVACITNQDSAPGTSTCKATGVNFPDLQSCIDGCYTEMQCVNGTGKCPMGSSYECVDTGQADAYTDLSNPDLATSYEHDPGVVDGATGTCLGQIYLFNGKPMTCNKPGLQNSWKSCCAADAEVVQGIKQQMTLIKAMSALKTVKNLYTLTTNAIEAYKMIQLIGAPVGYVGESANVAYAMYATDTGLTGSALTGSALTQSMNSMFLNPSTIAIAAVTYVVTELLSKSCTAEDVMTASLNDLGLCHYNGERCTKEIKLLSSSWCAQRTKYFCCFNSKTARVIHEQGRPQLQNIHFGELGGDACRGFTPEEFAMLDFSQIDMTEIFGDIKSKMPDVNVLKDDAQDKIQQSLSP